MSLKLMVKFSKYLQGNIASSSNSTAQATLASGSHAVIDCCLITGREGVGCVATCAEFLDGGKGWGRHGQSILVVGASKDDGDVGGAED
jgi:hypothetical protein